MLKGLASDPVPYVNTTILLGMSAAQWDLGLKILLGLASVVWTYLRIINEWKKYKGT